MTVSKIIELYSYHECYETCNANFGGIMRAKILERISGNKSSTKINLANMKITDEETQEIMDTMKQLTPNISTIDLDNNNIGDKGARIISDSLRNFSHLTELSIQFNDIGRDGAIELFSLKKVFPSLDILFRGNQITNVGEMEEIVDLAVRTVENFKQS